MIMSGHQILYVVTTMNIAGHVFQNYLDDTKQRNIPIKTLKLHIKVFDVGNIETKPILLC